MTELILHPAQLADMPVATLETLPAAQLAQVQHSLAQWQDWVKQARTRLDAALARRFADEERAARQQASKDFGTVHFGSGLLRVTVEAPKRVSWDQAQLAAIAQRIAGAGERVEDYIDVEYSVSESRFANWPPALRSQFEAARTVKPGKPSYQLALVRNADPLENQATQPDPAVTTPKEAS